MESALKEKVVLVVDDYEINTKLFSFFIEEAGGIPLVASDGIKCLNIVQNQHVDMIFMDKNMPEMDGIAATKAIRALDKGKEIVIIGITGYEEDAEIEDCLQAGMDMAIAKLKFTLEKTLEVAEKFFGSDNNLQSDGNQNVKNTGTIQEFINGETINDTLIIDYERALKEFENDDELLKSIIKEFITVIRKQLTIIQQALNVSDFISVQREAHGIKGGAANLRAQPLSDAAKLLELACKQNAAQDCIRDLVAKLEDSINTFDNYLADKLTM